MKKAKTSILNYIAGILFIIMVLAKIIDVPLKMMSSSMRDPLYVIISEYHVVLSIGFLIIALGMFMGRSKASTAFAIAGYGWLASLLFSMFYNGVFTALLYNNPVHGFYAAGDICKLIAGLGFFSAVIISAASLSGKTVEKRRKATGFWFIPELLMAPYLVWAIYYSGRNIIEGILHKHFYYQVLKTPTMWLLMMLAIALAFIATRRNLTFEMQEENVSKDGNVSPATGVQLQTNQSVNTQQVQYTQRPQNTQQPQYTQRPQYAQQPQNAQQPQYTQRPQYTQQPQYAQQPQYTQRPQNTQQAQYTQRPQYAQQPQYTQQAAPQARTEQNVTQNTFEK